MKLGETSSALVFSQGNLDVDLFEGYINSTKQVFDLLGSPVKGMHVSAGDQTLGDVKKRMKYSKKPEK